MRILVINGPNLNMLGIREKGIYGSKTLDEINQEITTFCLEHDIDADFIQSNGEGKIIDAIHGAMGVYQGIILNAGAFTHYSIAIADAIKCIDVPVIEVHMSNVYSREEYRRKSVIGEACKGVIAGFGDYSYILAVMAVMNVNKK